MRRVIQAIKSHYLIFPGCIKEYEDAKLPIFFHILLPITRPRQFSTEDMLSMVLVTCVLTYA